MQCGTGKEKGTMHPNVESGIFKINNEDADTNWVTNRWMGKEEVVYTQWNTAQLLKTMEFGHWNWKGNRQEGQGGLQTGNRLQVPDIFISLKQQEETNQRYIFFFSIQI